MIGEFDSTSLPSQLRPIIDELTSTFARLGYVVRLEKKGFIRAIRIERYGAYPYSAIVNADSLLFYVRKPGRREGVLSPVVLESGMHRKPGLNSSGELTIRIATIADAQALAKIVRDGFTARSSNHHQGASMNICRPAARVQQGALTLYSTSLPVRDLLTPGFYDIERLDPEDPDGKGYQRVLNRGRAKKLADYLVEGYKTGDAFLPTSVFLATDRDIEFLSETNAIRFNTKEVGPFSVVDGQHRLEGLRLAAERDAALLDFEVPINIAVRLPKIAQMCHFLIVNTTQKSVDRSVEQRIFARLTQALEFEDVPTLPKWIRKLVQSGTDLEALALADFLNETNGSPWKGKIEMANDEDSKATTITQRTFVKLTKQYVLAAGNPASTFEPERRNKLLLNYWTALAELLDIGKPTVLYKNNGVDLFLRFSSPFFMKLINSGDLKVGTMKQALTQCFDAMDGEYAGVGHPDWWLSGTGTASALNAAALGRILPELTKALHRSDTNSRDIEL